LLGPGIHRSDTTRRELSASDIDVKRVEGGGAMPKKYLVEMTLLVDAANVVVDTDEHTVNYEEDDAKAKQQFAKKVKVARDTAKGSGWTRVARYKPRHADGKGEDQPPNGKRRAA
jgi:hypothetical protein